MKAALVFICDQQYRSYYVFYAGLRKINILLLRRWEEGVRGAAHQFLLMWPRGHIAMLYLGNTPAQKYMIYPF